MTRLRGWAGCVIAVSWCGAIAILAGCSGSTGGSAASGDTRSTWLASPAGGRTSSTPVPAKSTGAAQMTAPLTGLGVTAAIAQRSAVAVAVAGSDPVGIGSADLVFEEMTSPIRYLAVFQSQQASTVGPVTGTRPTDGQALSVLHPVTGYDGGTNAFIAVLHTTKIIDAGYASHASLYSAGPDGLTVSTVALAATDRSDGPPPGLFSYRRSGASLASVQETHPTSVRVEVPGQPAEQWDFDARADRWVQTAGGPRVSVANLVIQLVPFKTVYLSHRYDQTTQVPRVLGTGQAAVFSGVTPGGSGGSAAVGTWFKPGLAAVTNYFDAAHVPMNFEPGPTWIVLAPPGTQTSQGGG
jgi:hypothetical protein